MSESIGMMTGAYFVGRRELLQWVNTLLQTDYKKVEDLRTGAAYCQILDALAPGKVNLKRCNFKATQEYQFVENFKVLQTAFKAMGISKVVNVVVLTGGSYQENLEFTQWLKAYYDQNVPQGYVYDAVGRRAGKASVAHGGSVAVPPSVSAAEDPAPTPVAKPEPVRVAQPKATPAATPVARAAPAATSAKAPEEVLRARPINHSSSGNAAPPLGRSSGPSTVTDSKQLSELTRAVAELQLQLDRAQQERDFYFDKLRDVEVYCQTFPDPSNKTIQDVMGILYAEDSE